MAMKKAAPAEAEPEMTVIMGANVDVSKFNPNDWDTFKLMCKIQQGAGSRFPELLEQIFGEEELERIEHELAEAKGAPLEVADLNNFFSKLTEEAKVKN